MQKDRINKELLPKHIAIVMDGNGRWAKQQGYDRIFGHTSGISTVRSITEASVKIGIQYLTLYTFSTENWNRPHWSRVSKKSERRSLKTMSDY